jgi:hypothetical protein
VQSATGVVLQSVPVSMPSSSSSPSTAPNAGVPWRRPQVVSTAPPPAVEHCCSSLRGMLSRVGVDCSAESPSRVSGDSPLLSRMVA